MKIKKLLGLGIMSATLFINANVAFAISFIDVPSNAWYKSSLQTLVNKKGIQGYEDGTFRPDIKMKQGEFIKMVVATINDELPIAQGEHWAMNYIREAEKLGYIDSGDCKTCTLDNPINRYQMAKILVRVVEKQGETFESDLDKYKLLIKDFNKVPEEYKTYVLKAYSRGLLTGYEDNSFKGDRELNRAEATTVVVRIFDKTEREEPSLDDVKPVEEVISNVEEVNESGIFNITHVKILKENPYKMDISEGKTSLAIRTYSDEVGVLALIKDGEVVESTQHVSGKDYVAHVLEVSKSKEDLAKYDYIAMYRFRDNVMILIPNPFK